MARLDVQDLADVAVGAGPDQLVAPRLLHAVRQLGHRSLRIGTRASDDGVVTHAVTQTPHPTHPSGLSTGCPPLSMSSARSPMGQARAQTPQLAP